MYYLNDKNILRKINKFKYEDAPILYVYQDEEKWISVEYDEVTRRYNGFHRTINDGYFTGDGIKLFFNRFSDLYQYIMKIHYNV